MDNTPIDAEWQAPPPKRFRPLALALELISPAIGLLGIIIGSPELITVGLLNAAFVYLGASWYFFKGASFTVWDILAATFFGGGIAVILVGFLFFVQDWEYHAEMVIVGHLVLQSLGFLAFCFMLLKTVYLSDKNTELGMSQKIFSRYVFLGILFYALGMNAFLENLG